MKHVAKALTVTAKVSQADVDYCVKMEKELGALSRKMMKLNGQLKGDGYVDPGLKLSNAQLLIMDVRTMLAVRARDLQEALREQNETR